MLRILFIFIFCSLAGTLLAVPFGFWPARPGLYAAVLMISAAWWLRTSWRSDPAAPEAPERRALLSLSGTLIVLSHLLASLWQIGPGMQLHTEASHAMALDNWALFGASLLMGWIARAPGPSQDERDRMIVAASLRSGHYALVLQLFLLAIWLGFGRDAILQQLSRAMLAQVLICCWIVSCVIHDLSCLLAYAHGRRLAGDAA